MVSIRPQVTAKTDVVLPGPQSRSGQPQWGSWLVQQALNASSSSSWRGKRTSRCFQSQKFGNKISNKIPEQPSHLATRPSHLTSPRMASLKRSVESDPLAASISSKVYVRSTKSGKVQKIVREVYLRQDIPCSSKLCHACAATTPRDASGRGAYLMSRNRER